MNPWIFGYGLNYVITSPLDDKKLEQVVAGYDVGQIGKRVDALMKTRGIVSSLCFVEIKHHMTKLLKDTPYRSGSWQVTNELSGSIAQIQRTVQTALNRIQTRMELRSDRGDPTGEQVYLYQPKSYVVVGSLEQFVGDYGVNEDKYSSFELFRRNLVNPEILTFDELFERARFIVHHGSSDNPQELESYVNPEPEIPF